MSVESVQCLLLCKGIDHLLAQHVAHLFIRDPVSVFAEKINLDDEVDTDHFEVLRCHFIVLSNKQSQLVEAKARDSRLRPRLLRLRSRLRPDAKN